MRYFLSYCLIFLLASNSELLGQSDYFRGAIFHSISVDDGLAHRTANTILQDKEGYIWIGTNNGLNRYDGHHMKMYRWDITNEYSLPNNRIIKLIQSKNERLWILSAAGDLCWYDAAHDQFITPTLVNELGEKLTIAEITVDNSNHIWVLTRDQKVYRIDTDQQLLEIPISDFIPVKPADQTQINKIFLDAKNRLWVTSSLGIHLFTTSDTTITSHQYFDKLGNLSMFNPDADGDLWFADGYKIYRGVLDVDQPQIQEFCDLEHILPEVRGYINNICTDQRGHVWISLYGFQLVELQQSNSKIIINSHPGKLNLPYSLGNSHIMDLFVDSYNVLWVGSQAGVFWNHLNQKPFKQISQVNGEATSLIDNIVQAIYRDKYLWIGTRSGLSVIDTVRNRFYNYPRLVIESSQGDQGGISCFLKDSKGQLWIGTANGGLFKVVNPDNPDKLQFIRIGSDHSHLPYFPHREILDIVEDDWGRVWVGTSYNGLYYIANNENGTTEFLNFRKVPDLDNFALTNLYKDPFENTIWAGTWEKGLIRIQILSPDKFDIDYFKNEENNTNSLSFNHVNPMVKTDQQTLWVGTIGGGLNKMVFANTDSIDYYHFTTHDGLPDNTIHSIQKDDLGNLWLGGTGLTRFNTSTRQITYFDKNDGLQSNLFIVNSDFKDKHRRLYFGGPQGLTFFKPSAIHQEESFPNIIINGLKILNKEIEVGEKLNGRILLPKAIQKLKAITIKEKENYLTLSFQTIHTASPAKNRLKYRLSGYQPEWIEAENAYVSITYSNLKPDTYLFEIKASNGDGVWNPQVTQLKITILPYWYKTFWAYTAYGLLFLILLWLFRRAILNQSNLRNNLKIAQIEREKDQEVAEMKTRFFNNITHELRTPLTLIKGPVEELLTNERLSDNVRKNYYHIIHQNGRKLFHLVNRLLDFRKAESGHFQLATSEDDFVHFAKEIFLSFQKLAEDKKISYTFNAKPQQISLFYDHDKMEIALCNLLSNAFKYSTQGNQIQMLIRQTSTRCIVEVTDTGKGMSTQEVNNIFNRFYQIAKIESSDIIGSGIGLSMVKNIMDLHQGEIKVQTQLDQGSTFSLYLPLGRIHLNDTQIISNFENSEQSVHYQSPTKEINQATVMSKLTSQLLIVEDNPEIRKFIRSIFEDHFAIKEAANGLEGITALKDTPPDIIISDIMMDEMDGIAFCAQVKANPQFFHIPLILLTARTSNVYKVDGLSSGADAYITKPFNAQVLKAQVNSLLKTRASLKEYFTSRITLGPKKIEVNSEEVLFLETLIALIEKKLAQENLSAESLATAMAMSHSTLYRKVKTYTGESINSFIRSIRLKQAAQLLKDTDLNVSEIAYQVGFSDVNYFGKCFKQQFSMSPTAYVKSLSQS